MAQGVVKVYDPQTGFGIIVSDADHSEILLRPGSLKGSIFRSLRQGQRINFDLGTDGDTTYATSVRIGSDGY
jgi:CspA family cold shock protein